MVVELQALGLRERSLEVMGWDVRGEVEQGAGEGGGGDALVVGGVPGSEGMRAVQADPRDALARHGAVTSGRRGS
ncbi:MAG: hypothetical protein WA701_16050 [Solirubrobacterales bacterium]